MIARNSIGLALVISLFWMFGCGQEKPQEIVSEIDYAQMILIPAGKFRMGSLEDEGYGDERPQHTVFISAFYIDKYEVTNAQYKKFMDVTGHKAPNYWDDERYNQPNQPVVGVAFNDALAYAQWAEKRLPTEAEWEKAAHGTDGRKYPWGNEWDNSKCNSDTSDDGYEYSAPVGSFPADVSPYGIQDCAGNVLEWCADWYDNEYYSRSPKKNPDGPDSGRYRVLRGGSFHYFPYNWHCAFRYAGMPTDTNHDIGFRCALDP